MKNIIIIVSTLCLFSFQSIAQLNSKTMALEGLWQYKNEGGFEVWRHVKEEMLGFAYRINKVGDTSRVEELHIRKVNKNLSYLLETNNQTKDSIINSRHVFIGGKRKLEFYNVADEIPYAISYSFGFLNRNKLKIKIQYLKDSEPITLYLLRIKD